jgi:hypothetical protein
MRQKWTVQEISGPQLLFIRSGCLFDVSYKVHTSPQHQLNLVNKPADMMGNRARKDSIERNHIFLQSCGRWLLLVASVPSRPSISFLV